MRKENVRFTRFRRGVRAGTIFLLTAGTIGCQGYSVTGGPGPLVSDPLRVTTSSELSALRSVVVLPLKNGIGVTLSPEELERATTSLLEELQSQSAIAVLNINEERTVSSALKGVLDDKVPDAVQAKSLGAKVGAKFVLFGALTKFAPLTGSSSPEGPLRFAGSIDDGDINSPQNSLRGGVAPTSRLLPGGVGFRLFLLEVSSGRTAWSATFDLEERSVAENLFQLPRQLEIAGNRQELERILRLGFRSAVKELELSRHAPK